VLGAAAGAAIVAASLHALTLAPTVTLVDSGELIVAARTLGVAHPPGFPLYVLLTHLLTLAPLGRVAQRANAASAAFAALAAGLLVVAAREALAGAIRGAKPPAAGSRRLDLLPPAIAGLLLAASRTLWSYATVAEVYTLTAALLVGVLCLALRWRREPSRPGRLVAACGLFGLALGAHHVTLILALPALLVLAFGTARRAPVGWRSGAACAAAALAAAVAVYAYLPWAASRATGLNWGDPRTLLRVAWHVSGRQYQSFFELDAASAGREARAYASILAGQFGPRWLPLAGALAAAGAVSLWRRDRLLLASLATLAAANAAYGLGYAIAEDKDAYYLPSVVALVLLAAAGAERVVARTGAWSVALLLVPAAAATGNWRFCDRSAYWIAEDYVTNVLDGVAPGGMLLTSDWQVHSPLLYAREVEGRRRDVVAIDVQLLRRTWYFDHLRRAFPGALDRARDAVDAFLEQLRAWERDPGRYARDATLNREINERFFAMILALVARHLEAAPVYATREVALPAFARDPELPPLLAARYALVPQGLVFELTPDRSFSAPPERPLRLRGLFDGSIPFGPEDVVSLKVRPAYLTMIASRGFYLAAHERHADAARAFREALALDPGFGPAREGLARAEAALRSAAEPAEAVRP
jgi:hypothetical protein